ncbi:NADPH-dependent ferric siderophore reductase, contains FAD-binding and SIP domains [Micromonospora pallida]|uniref:NADPH-dependent ferric siderophore reductase, contains FAD-binding and SIP domains n=1 Tax=Micromonospora pallida TaxID=145854 RepID=A0A1C6T5N8_9ACTN|nr:siderophore-interacting protein [Micromonospora pallida]SCL37146.1 NADPH-dependent ferric siderophore reductase, contains FAD-binding and SIP domains [Micromonospora pallida]
MPSTLSVAPWRVFAVEVRALRRLSPSFLRVTFTGPDLDRFADNGYDQRIKVALPRTGELAAELPDGPDWYQQWRAQPEETRCPIRTYTVRAVRPDAQEVDVDLVLHGDGGPATRWARRARLGDRLALVGPDVGYDGVHGGIEFRPPTVGTLLLAGDETAAPAICAILERLSADARGHALIEVPEAGDTLPVTAPPGMTVTWLPRIGAAHGSRLTPTVATLAGELLPAALPALTLASGGTPTVDSLADAMAATVGSLADVDVDRDVLWEVPDVAPTAPLYAWLAGEAAVIRGLRRHLVAERGLDRSAVAFMGYWRLGRTAD